MEIGVNRQKVVETFIDYDQFKYYQEPEFVGYRLLKGSLYHEDSLVELAYKYNDRVFYMQEAISKCDLPNSITQNYLLGDVKNKCVSTFTENGDKTLWSMEVTFQFSKDEGQDKFTFMKKTEEDMFAFKTYMENL
ncbi:hypothetical protein JN09_001425 [Acholeplasma morum]|jgi:hypothetical protein|uniref:hypothetical protein n=1 Tax=Paracholeplasma morum TaxID=264637 RepID=UPI001956F6E4|nr:hypothetical protein [Paracholeplasma morum]MBM7454081.1 hypothetical protein [Paracholeplasma morum]